MGLLDRFQEERSSFWDRLEELGEKYTDLKSFFSREGDPRLSYLVDSASYGIARVRDALSEDAPRETSVLIGTAFPSLLRPTPAMTIVQSAPATGPAANTDSATLTTSLGTKTATFERLWPVQDSLLSIESAEFVRLTDARQLLRLRLTGGERVRLASACPKRLRLFLQGDSVFQAIEAACNLSDALGDVHLRVLDPAGAPVARTTATIRITMPARASDLQLLPGRSDAFRSGTSARSLFTLPELYCFVDIEGVREALDALPQDMIANGRSVELELPLSRPLPESVHRLRFHLGCAPAANLRRIEIGSLLFSDASPRHRLPLEPGQELYEIVSAEVRGEHTGGRPVTLNLWEFDSGTVSSRADIVLRTHRYPAIGNAVSTCDVELIPVGSKELPAACVVKLALLITDGTAAGELLPSSLEWLNKSKGSNLTRTTRPLEAPGGLAWDTNALARVSSTDFATTRFLRRFLELYAAGVKLPFDLRSGLRSVRRSLSRRVVEDRVHGVDCVDVVFDESAFGGDGITCLVGEILARALAERTDALRYARLRWVTATGEVRHDFDLRPGERLPYPFS